MDPEAIVIGLVLANIVVAVICSLAAPHRWGWVLCMVALICNAYPAFLALRSALGALMGGHGSSTGTAIFLVLVVEELWFLYLLTRFPRRQPPT